MDTNNQLLHDIAGVDRSVFKTNNQLLEIIADGGGIGGETATWGSINGTLSNQSDLQTALDAKQALSEKGQANGYASLGPDGKVPAAELDVSAFNYLGSWDASTNTPTISDATGNNGDLYKVSVAGSQDLGSGSISFAVGDHVVHDGTAWENFGASESVASVNGLTGVVVLDANDVGALDITGGTLTGPLTVSTSATVPITTIDTSGGGAGVVSISDNGAAMTSGARVGYKLFGGATDAASTIYHSAGMEAHATEAWTPTAAGTSLGFDVTANGTLARVTALELGNDGTADFKGNKLIAVANGTDSTDGVNFGQLAVRRTSGNVDLQLDGEELIWPNDVTTGKIRLYNSTPGSNNTYYGFGILNETFVYQVDGSGSTHKFQSVDGSDTAVELFDISDSGGVVSHRDLHMSEQIIVNLGDPTNPRDGVNLQTLDGRLSAAQRTAIDNLTPASSTTTDIINALQAT